MTTSPEAPPTTVALVTLGCARNEVDSEELAGRLELEGFRLVDDASEADTVVVNTCGFVEAAKKDSVDTLRQETADVSAAEAASLLGISRVSARRYLEHLAETGKVEVSLRYGEVGRPERRYAWR